MEFYLVQSMESTLTEKQTFHVTAARKSLPPPPNTLPPHPLHPPPPEPNTQTTYIIKRYHSAMFDTGLLGLL